MRQESRPDLGRTAGVTAAVGTRSEALPSIVAGRLGAMSREHHDGYPTQYRA